MFLFVNSVLNFGLLKYALRVLAIRANRLTSCSLEEATSGVKELAPELYRTAEMLFR
jgi:hypothetical protein